jgi:multimeric flavodoxin WrbA
MKVILVNGSPHQKGCTYTALTEVKKTLEKNGIETEEFWVGNKPIAGCIGCGKCVETGKCFVDDKVNEFLTKVPSADGFVFGTPVHFASGSGMITSFMDRAFYGRRNLFKNKVASCVVSCRRGGATSTFDQINKYFSMNNMPIITSQYWNMVHGSKPEDVLKDEEGMQTMRTLGNNMAWILKCIDAGKKAGIAEPNNEKIVMTNFIL